LAADNTTIVDLTDRVAVSENSMIINDGAGTRAVFDVNAKGSLYSTSNNLKVGGYNLEASNTSIIGSNFSSLMVIGSVSVDPVRIDVTNSSHLSVTNVTKTYNGTATISSVPLELDSDNTIIVSGDRVNVSGTGSYNDRHVGTGKFVTVNISLSGVDSGNYALIDADGNANTQITGSVGTINQLESVNWTGPTIGGEWSNAANWDGAALPDRNNVAKAIIPAGYNVIYNSDVVGQISNTVITNFGILDVNGNNNFDFDSVITGSGTLKYSGRGVLTISGNNSYTGGLNIDNKEVLLASARALGNANSITSRNGSVSIGSGITLPTLLVNGDITIKSDITTTGSQIYNGDVTIYSDNNLETITYDDFTQASDDGIIGRTSLSDDRDLKTLTTANSDIEFNGKLKASLGSKNNKTSLIVNTCSTPVCAAGQVFFEDKVGFEFIDKDMTASLDDRQISGLYQNLVGYNKDNLYRLDVNAGTINIKANIMTWEEQIYRGPVLVGSNDVNKVKYLISVDPAVTFLSTVSDAGATGTHSLIVRAIKLPSGSVDPKINYNIDNIGNLALFDPYALSLSGSEALNLNIGDFGSFGSFSGSVAGYSQSSGARNNLVIIRNAPISITRPSTTNRGGDVIKALVSAGNNGNMMDFFKNLQFGGTQSGRNTTQVKSIEVFFGAEIREATPAKTGPAAQDSNSQENRPARNDEGKSRQNQDPESKDSDSGTQCSEGNENSAECKAN
jgi:hypothetical protein